MSYAIIMTYINITKFVLINYLEKDHSMIETRRLKTFLSKTNIIFKETYDTMVAYLKIQNQETDEHDFPEKIKKESKETSMNY